MVVNKEISHAFISFITRVLWPRDFYVSTGSKFIGSRYRPPSRLSEGATTFSYNVTDFGSGPRESGYCCQGCQSLTRGDGRISNSPDPVRSLCLCSQAFWSGCSQPISLKWHDELAAMSQAWADHCEFEHGQVDVESPPYGQIGQNLWKGSPRMSRSPQPIQDWYNEVLDYHFDTLTCNEGRECGHYTQVRNVHPSDTSEVDPITRPLLGRWPWDLEWRLAGKCETSRQKCCAAVLATKSATSVTIDQCESELSPLGVGSMLYILRGTLLPTVGFDDVIPLEGHARVGKQQMLCQSLAMKSDTLFSKDLVIPDHDMRIRFHKEYPVVWAETNRVGCGVMECDGFTIIVCNYGPM
ncbi:hypothetical protein Bbelb_405850 [Branchiostoma belcheri]|nr:hypothetical protein Bbelb_405850 [Branchiostoma belcheri]